MQVTGVMNTLLPKLAELLTEEYKLQKSVRGEIIFLRAELESMEAALLKISEAPIDKPPDIQVKLWARDVRELSYDIEDRIDTFMVRVDSGEPRKLQGLRGFINRSLHLLTKAKIRHKIGTDIKDIKSRINEVSERRDRYKVHTFTSRPVVPTVDSLRMSAMYRKTTEVVASEERSDDLIYRLMVGRDDASSDKQNQKIVSIVSFGGLGKTTLAKIVYEKIYDQFDCGAFVTVSRNPNMVSIFKNMLKELGNHNYEATWDEVQLINELRKFLHNKSYLIVVDDIWSYSVWNTIKYALMENKCQSRIIVTTRILDVAQKVGNVYHLKPLSLADSRKLFYDRVFTEGNCLPNQLTKISGKILKKCAGVPLAIITIASLLASKKGTDNMEKYWHQVYESMGSGLEEDPGVKDMRRILSVSYYDLPPHLKTCLLHLSLYPEDYIIVRQDLIWKWIGEGFVHKQHGKTLYEVGEEYFEDLINKSMINVSDYCKEAWSCKVHDVMLDLITSLSAEENFLTKLDGQRMIFVPSKIRRLSVLSSKEYDITQLEDMNLYHVRSLTVFSETFTLPAISNFQVLRVLDLYGCSQVGNKHCKDICNLFHLRYLRLSWTSVTEIPYEIKNLQFLQVLDLDPTKIEELPETFIQLRQLEYLSIDRDTRLPDFFGKLQSLQRLLPHIIIRSSTMLHDLGKLTQLRSLMILFRQWDQSYEEPFVQCLSNLVNLNSLQIFDCNNGLNSQCGSLSPGPQQLRSINMGPSIIRGVPRWMSSLSALSSLDISLLRLGEKDLQVLGGIPSLSSLYLSVREPTKERNRRLVIGSGHPFQCLTWFGIGLLAMEVEFAKGAMRKLQTFLFRLHVKETIDKFEDFNFGLENLSSVALVIVNMRCYYSKPSDVEDAEAAIQKALDMNPNRPELKMDKRGESWSS